MLPRHNACQLPPTARPAQCPPPPASHRAASAPGCCSSCHVPSPNSLDKPTTAQPPHHSLDQGVRVEASELKGEAGGVESILVLPLGGDIGTKDVIGRRAGDQADRDVGAVLSGHWLDLQDGRCRGCRWGRRRGLQARRGLASREMQGQGGAGPGRVLRSQVAPADGGQGSLQVGMEAAARQVPAPRHSPQTVDASSPPPPPALQPASTRTAVRLIATVCAPDPTHKQHWQQQLLTGTVCAQPGPRW